MMSETINAVVNNVSDRLGEIVEFVRPVIEAVNAVSITVVQETSLAGFAYVLLGISSIIMGVPFVICSIRAARLSREAGEAGDKGGESSQGCIFGWMIALSAVAFIIGIPCVLANLGSWLAPTREVLREVITHI